MINIYGRKSRESDKAKEKLHLITLSKDIVTIFSSRLSMPIYAKIKQRQNRVMGHVLRPFLLFSRAKSLLYS